MQRADGATRWWRHDDCGPNSAHETPAPNDSSAARVGRSSGTPASDRPGKPTPVRAASVGAGDQSTSGSDAGDGNRRIHSIPPGTLTHCGGSSGSPVGTADGMRSKVSSAYRSAAVGAPVTVKGPLAARRALMGTRVLTGTGADAG